MAWIEPREVVDECVQKQQQLCRCRAAHSRAAAVPPRCRFPALHEVLERLGGLPFELNARRCVVSGCPRMARP
jgi:hypothetical protein